jgi:hypothetical protein
MGLYEWAQTAFQNFILGGSGIDYHNRSIERNRMYAQGLQKRQIKIKSDNADDNVIVNLIGLIVIKNVTDLFGNGIEFDMPGEGETPQSEYIDHVWDANKQEILLQKQAMFGSTDGTCFFKIIPDGVIGKDGVLYPRLMIQDPLKIKVFTKYNDIEYVEKYVIQYTYKRPTENGKDKEVEYRETTAREGNVWKITEEERIVGQKAWTSLTEQIWDESFPPIIHWQNYPNPYGVYGDPDITDHLIELQDYYNFQLSNIGKTIRYHAHPQTVIIGPSASDVKTEPGKAIFLPEGSEAFNLEMSSDLASSFNFAMELKKDIFTTAHQIDLSTVADKIGNTTNFGLRVWNQDKLAYLHTKQELYGDALVELNRRLSVLGGFEDDGGDVIWPEILPVNASEEINALKAKLDMGVLSKQSIAKELGVDWEAEQKRLEDEKTASNVGNNNIGAMYLNNFMKGK